MRGKTLGKIRKASRKLRRKRSPNYKKRIKASKRWLKQRSKVSKLQRKAANQRADWTLLALRQSSIPRIHK